MIDSKHFCDVNGEQLELNSLVVLSHDRRPGARFRVIKMFYSVVDGTPRITANGPPGPSSSCVVSRPPETVRLWKAGAA